jgi:hypothetical protein
MFGAHFYCAAAPSRQAGALTHEPPPRVTLPRAQLNGSAVLHQPPFPAYVPAASRAPGAHRSSLHPLVWTAARWAARPMYSTTAWPSSMAQTLVATAPNSTATGRGGLPRASGFKLYHAIVGCVGSGQDCGFVFVGSALLLAWALFIAYVAWRHRQTMRSYVSGCTDRLSNPASPRLEPSSNPASPRLESSKA